VVFDSPFSVFFFSKQSLELLIVGCGRYNHPLNPQVRQFVKSIGMKLETVDSRNAASTYNILNEEGRIVAAALLPYGVTS
jgi:NADH dehydrogenase [ubiquinone] 1 alpha subcomplex assembly factor 3